MLLAVFDYRHRQQWSAGYGSRMTPLASLHSRARILFKNSPHASGGTCPLLRTRGLVFCIQCPTRHLPHVCFRNLLPSNPFRPVFHHALPCGLRARLARHSLPEKRHKADAPHRQLSTQSSTWQRVDVVHKPAMGRCRRVMPSTRYLAWHRRYSHKGSRDDAAASLECLAPTGNFRYSICPDALLTWIP
ncbi:hypothetical protein D9M71_501420 [compost metagenome]